MKLFDKLARWWIALACLVLAGVVFIVYQPVIHGRFLWDDEFLVVRNPLIRSPVTALELFRHFLFTDARGEFYRPLQNLSYQVDYLRAGLDSSTFHRTNLIIHACNGVLLFALLARLLQMLGNVSRLQAGLLAFASAAFWVVHPVHSAIAAYISGRADSLALAGLLAGWLCWEAGVGEASIRSKAFLVLAGPFALAACCSKEIGLAGVGLFVLYLWLLRPNLENRVKIGTTAGAIVVAGCYLLLRQLPEPNIQPPAGPTPELLEKMTLCLRALGDYLRLTVYPGKLFMERQVSLPTGLFNDPIKNDALFPYLGYLGLGIIAILLASFFWQGKGRRLRLLGALWFGVMILPVSNLFTLNASVAEHWLYIPMAGLLIWLIGVWLDLGRHWQRLMLVFWPCVIVALAVRTWHRAGDWVDATVFYRATIRDGGDSVRMRINLAAEYQKMGKWGEAERLYRSTLLAIPHFPLAVTLLARNLELQGRQGEAAELRASQKANGSAAKSAREVYLATPHSWPAARALAATYEAARQPGVALEVVRGFASRNWWNAEAQSELGRLNAVLGKRDAALEAYRQAARLDVRNAEPLNQSALLFAADARFPEALQMQRDALARDGDPRQREVLALIESLRLESGKERHAE